MEVQTEYHLEDKVNVEFKLVKIGSPFKYNDGLFFKASGEFGIRIADLAHYRFKYEERVRVVKIKIEEI